MITASLLVLLLHTVITVFGSSEYITHLFFLGGTIGTVHPMHEKLISLFRTISLLVSLTLGDSKVLIRIDNCRKASPNLPSPVTPDHQHVNVLVVILKTKPSIHTVSTSQLFCGRL